MQPESIVLVDDNPLLTEAYEAALTSAGYAVHTAHSGEDGLALINATHPHAVLLDIRMHGMDGIDVLRTLRGAPETADINVVVFTANEDDDIRRQAHEAGATQYLKKSEVSIQDLVGHLNELVRK